MKKFFVLVFMLLAVSSVFGQIDPFLPPHPITFGMGGAFTAGAEGLTSFYYNPAGFASEDGEFTAASASAYLFIDRSLVDFVLALLKGQTATPSTSVISRQVIPEGFMLPACAAIPEDFMFPEDGVIPEDFVIPGCEELPKAEPTKGTEPSKGTELPPGLPPLPEGLLELAEQLGGVSKWIEALEGEDRETATKEAIKQVIKIAPELAPVLPDPEKPEEFETFDQEALLAAVIESPILETTPEVDDEGEPVVDEETGKPVTISNLAKIIDAVNEAVKEGSNGNAPDIEDEEFLDQDWKKAVNAAVEKSRDSLPGGSARLGAHASIAYAGNGFGIGLFVGVDGTLGGKTLLAAKGRLLTNITLAGGFAIPLGPFTIGAQLRPSILGYTDINPVTALLGGGTPTVEKLLAEAVYTGVHIGVDVGAKLDLDPFTLGLTIKNLIPIPVIWTSTDSFTQYLEGIAQNAQIIGTGVVASEVQETLYQVPPLLFNFGAQFKLDFGDFWFVHGLKVNADFQDIFGFFRYLDLPLEIDKATLGDREYNLLRHLHLGAELELFGGLLATRVGFGDNFLTAGIGLDLFVVEINAAVGATDLRTTADGVPEFNQVGFSVEAAIRF